MIEGMLFVSVWFIGFLCFMLYPLLSSLKISFTKSTLMNLMNGDYVGMGNYKTVITDPNFGPVFVDTLLAALIDIPIIVIFALFIATLLNKAFIGRTFFRSVFFIPVILSGVIMKFMFDQQLGHISIFDELGGGKEALNAMFGDAFVSRIGLIMWRSSVEILIFLGGLQGIPRSQYEAAEVDGATSWECFWKITLPYISPIILLNFIYAAVDSFTDPLSPMMAFIKLKMFSDFGYAAAMSWMYLITVMIVIVVFLGIGRRFVYYAGEAK